MPVYPGDPAVRLERLADIATGSPYTLSQLSMCLHSGTHLDSPSHVIGAALTIDNLPIEAFALSAQVVDTGTAASVEPEHFANLMLQPREALLLKSSASQEPGSEDGFRVDISARAAEIIVARRLGLVGTESMDVEKENAPDLPIHKLLLGAGVLILENLDLRAVAPGKYRLLCFPLKLLGAEASPCRAVLETIE
jgi:arylformamidase